MNDVKKYSQYRGCLDFVLEKPALQNVNFITIRKGDLTSEFSPVARWAFSAPGLGVEEVQILQNQLGGNQYLRIRRNSQDPLPEENLNALKGMIVREISRSQNAVIDEEAMLQWAEERKQRTGNSVLEERVTEETQSIFVPHMVDKTGHNVGINFLGFSEPDHRGEVDAIIALDAHCKSCTMSSRVTLASYGIYLQQHLDNDEQATQPKTLRRIHVLPDRAGSPSYSFNYEQVKRATAAPAAP